MKFWKENLLSGEFEMSEREVARTFQVAMFRAVRSEHEGDWALKLERWPRERTLRDWMTRKDGLNAFWEDEVGFAEILDLVTDCPCGQPVRIVTSPSDKNLTRDHFRVAHRERSE